jgi:hypothetical protein
MAEPDAFETPDALTVGPEPARLAALPEPDFGFLPPPEELEADLASIAEASETDLRAEAGGEPGDPRARD